MPKQVIKRKLGILKNVKSKKKKRCLNIGLPSVDRSNCVAKAKAVCLRKKILFEEENFVLEDISKPLENLKPLDSDDKPNIIRHLMSNRLNNFDRLNCLVESTVIRPIGKCFEVNFNHPHDSNKLENCASSQTSCINDDSKVQDYCKGENKCLKSMHEILGKDCNAIGEGRHVLGNWHNAQNHTYDAQENRYQIVGDKDNSVEKACETEENEIIKGCEYNTREKEFIISRHEVISLPTETITIGNAHQKVGVGKGEIFNDETKGTQNETGEEIDNVSQMEEETLLSLAKDLIEFKDSGIEFMHDKEEECSDSHNSDSSCNLVSGDSVCKFVSSEPVNVQKSSGVIDAADYQELSELSKTKTLPDLSNIHKVEQSQRSINEEGQRISESSGEDGGLKYEICINPVEGISRYELQLVKSADDTPGELQITRNLNYRSEISESIKNPTSPEVKSANKFENNCNASYENNGDNPDNVVKEDMDEIISEDNLEVPKISENFNEDPGEDLPYDLSVKSSAKRVPEREGKIYIKNLNEITQPVGDINDQEHGSENEETCLKSEDEDFKVEDDDNEEDSPDELEGLKKQLEGLLTSQQRLLLAHFSKLQQNFVASLLHYQVNFLAHYQQFQKQMMKEEEESEDDKEDEDDSKEQVSTLDSEEEKPRLNPLSGSPPPLIPVGLLGNLLAPYNALYQNLIPAATANCTAGNEDSPQNLSNSEESDEKVKESRPTPPLESSYLFQQLVKKSNNQAKTKTQAISQQSTQKYSILKALIGASKPNAINTENSPGVKNDTEGADESEVGNSNYHLKRKRIAFSAKQYELLQTTFDHNNFPEPGDQQCIARQLKAPYRSIKMWFQNKRANARKKLFPGEKGSGRTVSGEKIPGDTDTRFYCDRCPSAFICQKYLLAHMDAHELYTKTCQKCRVAFTHDYLLHTHTVSKCGKKSEDGQPKSSSWSLPDKSKCGASTDPSANRDNEISVTNRLPEEDPVEGNSAAKEGREENCSSSLPLLTLLQMGKSHRGRDEEKEEEEAEEDEEEELDERRGTKKTVTPLPALIPSSSVAARFAILRQLLTNYRPPEDEQTNPPPNEGEREGGVVEPDEEREGTIFSQDPLPNHENGVEEDEEEEEEDLLPPVASTFKPRNIPEHLRDVLRRHGNENTHLMALLKGEDLDACTDKKQDEDEASLAEGGGGGGTTTAEDLVSRSTPLKAVTKKRLRRRTTVFTETQHRVLYLHFTHCNFPDPSMFRILSRLTGLTPHVIKIWFQNERSRQRRQVLNNEVPPPHVSTSGGGGGAAPLREKKPYKCRDCGVEFAMPAFLVKHCMRHIPTENVTREARKCPICMVEFETQKLHSHFMAAHNLSVSSSGSRISEDENGPEEENLCHLCHSRFPDLSSLSAHKNLHLSDTEYGDPPQCSQCRTTFVNVLCLEAHMATHDKFKWEYSCSRCGMRFYDRVLLESHLISHSLSSGASGSGALQQQEKQQQQQYQLISLIQQEMAEERSSLKIKRESSPTTDTESCKDERSCEAGFPQLDTKMGILQQQQSPSNLSFKFIPVKFVPVMSSSASSPSASYVTTTGKSNVNPVYTVLSSSFLTSSGGITVKEEEVEEGNEEEEGRKKKRKRRKKELPNLIPISEATTVISVSPQKGISSKVDGDGVASLALPPLRATNSEPDESEKDITREGEDYLFESITAGEEKYNSRQDEDKTVSVFSPKREPSEGPSVGSEDQRVLVYTPYSSSSSSDYRKRRRTPTHFNSGQRDVLEAYYKYDNFPDPSEQLHLSEYLRVPYSVIKTWYQNTRKNHRKHLKESQKTAETVGGGPFECSECRVCFVSKVYLEAHVRQHSSEELQPFRCPLCGRRFPHQAVLDIHTRMGCSKKCKKKHDQIRPFSSMTKTFRLSEKEEKETRGSGMVWSEFKCLDPSERGRHQDGESDSKRILKRKLEINSSESNVKNFKFEHREGEANAVEEVSNPGVLLDSESSTKLLESETKENLFGSEIKGTEANLNRIITGTNSSVLLNNKLPDTCTFLNKETYASKPWSNESGKIFLDNHKNGSLKATEIKRTEKSLNRETNSGILECELNTNDFSNINGNSENATKNLESEVRKNYETPPNLESLNTSVIESTEEGANNVSADVLVKEEVIGGKDNIQSYHCFHDDSVDRIRHSRQAAPPGLSSPPQVVGYKCPQCNRVFGSFLAIAEHREKSLNCCISDNNRRLLPILPAPPPPSPPSSSVEKRLSFSEVIHLYPPPSDEAEKPPLLEKTTAKTCIRTKIRGKAGTREPVSQTRDSNLTKEVIAGGRGFGMEVGKGQRWFARHRRARRSRGNSSRNGPCVVGELSKEWEKEGLEQSVDNRVSTPMISVEFVCPDDACGGKFPSATLLQIHRQAQHSHPPPPLPCITLSRINKGEEKKKDVDDWRIWKKKYLEAAYMEDNYPSAVQLQEIARGTHSEVDIVQQWFQERRIDDSDETKEGECPLCRARFVKGDRFSLARHARIHNTNLSLVCWECGSDFGSAESLVLHLTSTDHAPLFNARVHFTDSFGLLKQRYTHRDIKLTFLQLQVLSHHFKLTNIPRKEESKLLSRRLKLPLKTVQTWFKRQRIAAALTSSVGAGGKCDLCPGEFVCGSLLTRHKALHVLPTEDSSAFVSPFFCSKCPTSFLHETVRDTHSLSHALREGSPSELGLKARSKILEKETKATLKKLLSSCRFPPPFFSSISSPDVSRVETQEKDVRSALASETPSALRGVSKPFEIEVSEGGPRESLPAASSISGLSNAEPSLPSPLLRHHLLQEKSHSFPPRMESSSVSLSDEDEDELKLVIDE